MGGFKGYPVIDYTPQPELTREEFNASDIVRQQPWRYVPAEEDEEDADV